MIYLLLSIASSSVIVVLFKYFEKYKVDIFYPIIINYFVASALGLFLNDYKTGFSEVFQSNWIFLAIIIGTLLIAMFFVIGLSIQKAGITVTTVSSRMSFIIPITFSIIYYNESVGTIKAVGIVLAILAVLFSVMRKGKLKLNQKYFYLPFIAFLGGGIIDALVKYSQQEYLSFDNSALFSGILFTFSAVIGVFISFFKKTPIKSFFKPKILISGILLGIANFGSMLFFINALAKSKFESSVVFGFNHIGIILVTAVFAIIVFKEKLSLINKIGILLAFLAILILSYV
ncbi:MAG: EamA family transporter [Bacteroidetes bacterium]|nr:EamA family transporter [Bacteroidota bacterium]